MAVRSMRNPLTKRLPTVRRMSSDVQPSCQKTFTTLEMEMNAQLETEIDEQLLAGHSEEELTVSDRLSVSQSDNEETADLPQASQNVTLYSNSKVTSSFQCEFLKMLTQTKHPMSDTSEHACKQRKIKHGSVAISNQTSRHRPFRLQKSASKPAKSRGFSSAAPSTCSETSSRQSVTEMQGGSNRENYLKDDVKFVTDSTSSCAETSSLKCDSGTAGLVAHSISKVISSDMRDSQEFVAADIFLSLEKPDRSSSAEATCVSYEGVRRDDGQSLAPGQSCYTTQPDISPPVLSVPDPVNEIGTNPPLLEPSYCVADERSLASMKAASNAISEDVWVAGSTCELRTLPNLSESIASELHDGQNLTHAAETSSADVDISDTSVGHSVNYPATCPTSLAATCNLPVSTSAVTANTQNAQPDCQLGNTAADCKPTRSFHSSALARFRPMLSANLLLPPAHSFRMHMIRGARPNRN